MSIQIRKKGTLAAYKDALLQTHSHRILREEVNSVLTDFNLMTSEWVILCLIHDNQYMKLATIVEILEVESPHVTNLINDLVKKKLVKRVADKVDKRAKKVSLTLKGKTLLPEVEERIIEKMNKILVGVSDQELDIYEKVQQIIIDNNKK